MVINIGAKSDSTLKTDAAMSTLHQYRISGHVTAYQTLSWLVIFSWTIFFSWHFIIKIHPTLFAYLKRRLVKHPCWLCLVFVILVIAYLIFRNHYFILLRLLLQLSLLISYLCVTQRVYMWLLRRVEVLAPLILELKFIRRFHWLREMYQVVFESRFFEIIGLRQHQIIGLH